MNKIISLLAAIVSISITFGQVQVYVKKGSLKVGDAMYQAGAVISLKSTDKVVTTENTKAIAKKQVQLAELEKNKIYTYKQLVKKLDGQANFSQAFINAATSQQVAQKSNAGATHRGSGEDPMAFFPLDSVKVLSDSLLLELSPSLQLKSDIKLYCVGSMDTIRFAPVNEQLWVKDLIPGTYFWEYNAKIGMQNYKFKNIFFVPLPLEKEQYFREISTYKNQMEGFSEEMRAILLEEFLQMNHWVVVKKQ